MNIATFVMIVAITVGLVVPTTAEDRPSDPFGDYTTELKDAPIVKTWDLLRYEMVIEKGYFHKCLQTKDCPSVAELAQRLDEIRQYQGSAGMKPPSFQAKGGTLRAASGPAGSVAKRGRHHLGTGGDN